MLEGPQILDVPAVQVALIHVHVPSGRVEPGILPGGTVARGMYLGPYEGLYQAWREFDDWIAAQGRIPYDDLWEVYSTDPAHVPGPVDYRTQLNRRLR